MSSRPAAWGAIFDWDGVITASADLHRRSWEILARRRGLPLPDGHFERGFGQRNEDIIPAILGWTDDPAEVRRLADEKEACYRELVCSEGLRPLPGVREWLRALAEAGIPCAVGSSTPRENILCGLDALCLGAPFQAVVASEDVHRGKPHPEVFATCGQRLGLAPGRGVVFEDAPAGIEAGRAAGFRVIALATTHPPAALRRAHRIVGRMDELDVGELGAWVLNGRRPAPRHRSRRIDAAGEAP